MPANALSIKRIPVTMVELVLLSNEALLVNAHQTGRVLCAIAASFLLSLDSLCRAINDCIYMLKYLMGL